MSDRSLRRLTALVATALLAVVAVGSVLGARSVADDLRNRSETALAAAGLDDVLVEFRGREAELSGGNDVEARLATSLISALPGVRQVDTDADVDDVVPGASRFEIDRAGDDVEISGAVLTPDDAAAIKVGVATAFRTTITGDVAVDRTVTNAPWVAAMPAVFEIVAGVDGLELEIRGDGTVELGGDVGDEAIRSSLLRQMRAALPDLELVDSLHVVAPSRKGD